MSCAGWMLPTVVWLLMVVLIESIWIQRLKARDRMAKEIIRLRVDVIDGAYAAAEEIVAKAHQKASDAEKSDVSGEDT